MADDCLSFWSYRNVPCSSLGPLLRGQLLLRDPVLDDGELLPGEGSEDGQITLRVIFHRVVRRHGVVALRREGDVGGVGGVGAAAAKVAAAQVRDEVLRLLLLAVAAGSLGSPPMLVMGVEEAWPTTTQLEDEDEPSELRRSPEKRRG